MKLHWIRKEKLAIVKRTTVLLEEPNHIKDNGGLDELLRKTHQELQAILTEAVEYAHRTGWPLWEVKVDFPGLLDSFTWSGYIAGKSRNQAGHFFLENYTIEKLHQWFDQLAQAHNCTFKIKRIRRTQRWHIFFTQCRQEATARNPQTATQSAL